MDSEQEDLVKPALEHYDNILQLLGKEQNVDVIYLDFAKASDKVDFNILLQKVKMLGINGKILNWISSFLINRTQSLIVNAVKSNPVKVHSRVSQGSVLGPLLFLILIIDINQLLQHSTLSSFADDTKILKGISNSTDVINLQSDLQEIYQRSDDNNMKFNEIKVPACLLWEK